MKVFQKGIALLTILLVTGALAACSVGATQSAVSSSFAAASQVPQSTPPVYIAPGADSTSNSTSEEEETTMNNQITLTVNGTVLTATLADNSSAEALKELLAEGPLTIKMRDYANMEKVGPIGTDLPTNDEQITTEAGDLILYMGNAFVIYYGPNSWNFTRLGKIDDVASKDLKGILGSGNAEVTLALPKE